MEDEIWDDDLLTKELIDELLKGTSIEEIEKMGIVEKGCLGIVATYKKQGNDDSIKNLEGKSDQGGIAFEL